MSDLNILSDELTCRLILGQNFDIRSASAFNQAIVKMLAESPEKIIIDLSIVKFIDSYGIGMLITLFHKVQAGGAELVLIGSSPLIKSTLMLAGLHKLMTLR